MTPDNRKRRKNTWGSVIGWIIFILLIAGRPIFSTLQRVLGNNVALPANLPNLIPLAIGGLVVLSIAVAVLRAIGNATSSRFGLDGRLSSRRCRCADSLGWRDLRWSPRTCFGPGWRWSRGWR